jgi:hypothetical protein
MSSRRTSAGSAAGAFASIAASGLVPEDEADDRRLLQRKLLRRVEAVEARLQYSSQRLRDMRCDEPLGDDAPALAAGLDRPLVDSILTSSSM